MTVTLVATASVFNGGRPGFEHWQRMLVDWVRSNRPDLTNRQLAVLSIVLDDPKPQTVRGLAGHLCIGKPAVSRALDRLEKLQYLRRMPDKTDRRNVLIVPTRIGEAFIEELVAEFKQ